MCLMLVLVHLFIFTGVNVMGQRKLCGRLNELNVWVESITVGVVRAMMTEKQERWDPKFVYNLKI